MSDGTTSSLSASRSGLQSLISTCEAFAAQNNLKFSTDNDPKKSKTKCIIFGASIGSHTNVPKILLNGNPLPWVTQVKHLGHILDNENNLVNNTRDKRFKFIGKINSLAQEFYFAAPEVKVNLYNKYVSSFYGSNLWNLFCHETEKVYSAYNISIRQAFRVPFNTHRYLRGEAAIRWF